MGKYKDEVIPGQGVKSGETGWGNEANQKLRGMRQSEVILC